MFSVPLNAHAMENIPLLEPEKMHSYNNLSSSNEIWINIDFDKKNQKEIFDEQFFNKFPEDILKEICKITDFEDIVSLSKTCHLLNQNKNLAELKLAYFLENTDLNDLYNHTKIKGAADMLQILSKVLNLKNFEALSQLSSLAGTGDNKLIEVRELAYRYRYSLYFCQKGGRDILEELSLKLNKDDNFHEFSLSDFWFSIKRDPYFLIFVKITSNILYPAIIVTGTYFLTNLIYNWYLAYYSSPNFQPTGTECMNLYACGNQHYSYSFSLSENTALPNMSNSLSIIENQANTSKSYAKDAASFFNGQLNIIKEQYWHYMKYGKFTNRFELCTREDFLRKGISFSKRQNSRSLDIRLFVNHFYPECNSRNTFFNTLMVTWAVGIGLVGWIAINIFLPFIYF